MLLQDSIKIHSNIPASSSTCSVLFVFGSSASQEQNKPQVVLVSLFGSMVTVMEGVQIGFVSQQKVTENKVARL